MHQYRKRELGTGSAEALPKRAVDASPVDAVGIDNALHTLVSLGRAYLLGIQLERHAFAVDQNSLLKDFGAQRHYWHHDNGS